ncbi:MAG: ROK family protein, partial [Gemmatimonadales bacterium]
MRYVVGMDIGGTNLVVGCVAEDGSMLSALRSEATRPEEGADAVIHRLTRLARAAMEETAADQPDSIFTGVGIGAPGPLNTRTGVVLLTPNLGWVDMPLRDRLQQSLNLPASLDNDANCAVLGECWLGAARDARVAIGITIGTG